MEKISDYISDVYTENILLDSEIAKITTQKISNRQKDNLLAQLQDTVNTTLAKNHVAYYRKRIKRQRYMRCEQFIAILIIPVFLFLVFDKTGLFLLLNAFIITAIIVLIFLKRNAI